MEYAIKLLEKERISYSFLKKFRECKKYLNRYAAVTTLEFLDSSEIRDLAFNYMMKLRGEKLREKIDPNSGN